MQNNKQIEKGVKRVVEEYGDTLKMLDDDDKNVKEKPFYTFYSKERSKLNPLRYILGKYKTKIFIKGKQPTGYKSLIDRMADEIILDTSNITFYEKH